MTTHEVLQLKELLSPETKVTILTHKNPDGDALGSTLGLKAFLKQLQIDATVVVPNAFPDNFNWLPGCNTVVNFEAKTALASDSIQNAQVLFFLDFNSLHRMDDGLKGLAENATAYKVLIDHHQQPDEIADFVLHDVNASSTCQLVYEFIRLLGYEDSINAETGTCIYTGIITDTGSFRYRATTSETHRIAAALMDKGINHTGIHDAIFSTNTLNRLRLLGYSISEKLKLFPELRTAYISLTAEELERFNYKTGDTEGVVNYALSIQNVKLAAMFTERNGEIRISFRSTAGFDVNAFARKHFNGGGHNMAAGGKSDSSLEETIQKFESLLNAYQSELLA